MFESIKDHFIHNKIITIALIILIVAPVVICVIFIMKYGVNEAQADQIDIIPLFDKLYSGNLTFNDLYSQLNEHRFFFPYLIMLLLGSWSHYNNIVEMYFNSFILLLISCALFYAYIKNRNINNLSLAAFLPVIWIIMSLRQWENLLWGMTIGFPMAVLFFIIASLSLELCNNRWWVLVIGIGSGIISSYSLANGLLVWPIGLAQIVIRNKLYHNSSVGLSKKFIFTWILVGIITFIAYFINFNYPSHHSNYSYAMSEPLNAIGFFLAAIGSPLSVNLILAIGIGIFLSCLGILIVYLLIKNGLEKNNPICIYFSLIVFAFSSAALLVYGRLNFGVEQALASRYTTITSVGVIGIYLLILSIDYSKFSKIKLFSYSAFTLIICVGLAYSWTYAVAYAKDLRNAHNLCAYYLDTYKIQGDETLMIVNHNPAKLRVNAALLEKYKLNVFYVTIPKPADLPPLGISQINSIEAIDGKKPEQQIMVDSEQTKAIGISGYAIDEEAQNLAGGIYINIDDEMDIPAYYGIERPDVVQFFKNGKYLSSGFQASFAASIIGKGEHTVSLKILNNNKTGYYESSKKVNFTIR